MAPNLLPWLPTDLTEEVSSWDFTHKVSQAMSDIGQAGADLMKPIGQQLAALVPDPPAPPPPPPPEPPPTPRYDLGTAEDWGFGSAQAPAPSPPPQASPRSAAGTSTASTSPQAEAEPVTHAAGSFQLPEPSAFLGHAAETVGQAGQAVGGAASSILPSPARTATAPSGAPSEPNAYLRQAAARRGIDPDQVSAVMGEEGPGGWGAVGRFDTGTSYGPLQLHYAGGSNPKGGMGDDFTRDTGIDLRTDGSVASHQAAIDYALDRLSKTGDYREWYGADPALGSRMTAVKRVAPSMPQSLGEVPEAARAAGRAAGQAITGGLDSAGIEAAYKGVPYTFGGPGGRSNAALGVPTDCSGFVSAVWQDRYGVPLVAHTDGAYNQLKGLGAREVEQEDAKPGDVVFYMGAGTGGAIAHHMGIYAGDGRVLDMSVSGGDGVKERPVGHGGSFVIMRDPRLGESTPRGATAPPPIVETGVAEVSGGRKPSQARIDAASEAGPILSPFSATPARDPISEPWSLPFGSAASLTSQAGGIASSIGSGISAASDTLGRAASGVAGTLGDAASAAWEGLSPADAPRRTAPTWEDPLAPVRESVDYIARRPEQFLPAVAYGRTQGAAADVVGRRVGEAAGLSADPTMAIPESVPFYGGTPFSQQDVAGQVGQAVLDPLNFAGVPGAVRGGQGVLGAVARALPGVGELEALGRGGAGLVRRAGSALAGSPAPDLGGVMHLGSGVVPGPTDGAAAARRLADLEASGAPESTLQKWRALAEADVADPAGLAERLRTVEMVTPEDARAMLGERPEYLQPVAQFLLEQRRKVLGGGMTARDVGKAYYMTLMSMRSTAQEQGALQRKLGSGFRTGAGEAVPPNAQLGNLDGMVNVHNGEPLGPIFTEPGPNGRRIVRPESAGAAWVWTDEGQRALDSLEEGEFLPDAWEGGRRTRLAFGSDTVGGNGALRPLTEAEVRSGKVNLTNLPAFVDELNQDIAALKAAGRESEVGAYLSDQSKRLMGIGTGKSPFIKQLLGFGDAVTIDAREINYWLSGRGLLRPGDTSPGANMARAASRWWGSERRVGETLQPRIQAAVDDLAARYPELTEGIDPADAGHILHHWIWDRSGGSATAHTDVMASQRLAAGAAPRLADGLGTTLGNAAQGAAVGAASEDVQANAEGREADPWGRLERGAVGATLGALAGSRTARSATGKLLGSGLVPERTTVPSPGISEVGRRAMEAYTALTPARVEKVTARGHQVAADAISRKTRPGAMPVPPDRLIPQIHAAVVRNLDDTKVVMTGLNPGALRAFLRGEGLTSKAETGDLATINEITRGQVNVAGGRAAIVDGKKTKVPYTLEQAADFAQRESEQMRAVTGGTRFPDPETGAIDPEAPKVMYAYVSEGQPLVGPNRPTLGLVWKDETPRVSSVNHPFGLLSRAQDIHASMAEGNKALVYSPDAIRGARHAPAAMEGGRLVEAAPGVPSSGELAFGWERGGVDIGGGRKIADSDYLVGPEGESQLRATALVTGMSADIQRAIARGEMTDPEQIAAVLMRGGAPQWKPGWGSVMNPTRTESLIIDPALENVRAIYITGTPKNLTANLAGAGKGAGAGERLGELETARRIRAAIKEKTGEDVPILFNDISRQAASKAQLEAGASNADWAPRLISDAEVLEGPPEWMSGSRTLAPGRARIVERYTGATDPATGEPYMNLGSGFVPRSADPDEIADLARRGAAARGERIPGLPEGARPIGATPEREASRLRLDLFPPQVRDDIAAAAEGADYARTQRRGVLGDEAVSRLADDDARSVDDLIKGGKLGRAYNPEETVALRNAVASQADVVRGLSAEIAEATTSGATPDLLIARRAAESTKLQGLVQVAEGARAEAGRTLRQYAQQAKLIELDPSAAIARIRAKIADPDEFAAIVDEYTRAVNEGADPIVMAKLWSKVERGEIKAGDVFALYRRFNMLSGPRTFEVNALSGGLNLGYEMLGKAGTQALRGRFGEAAAEVGAPFKAGARAFQNMAETMWHGVSAEQAARGDIPRNLSARTDNPSAKAALTAMEIPDRLNAGVDQFFRTLTEDWAATILAHKQARADGLTPRSPDWAEAVATKLEAIREDVSAFPEVQAMADRVTFSEEPGQLVKKLEELKKSSPNLVGFVAPFIRTPANIASRAVDISPLGPARTAFEAATGMGRGRKNISTRVRDNVIGTSATAWAYTKAQQGELTGAGPDDPEKQAELRATGWQPYSIKIGDQYWSYANFAPFSLALSAGAAAAEAQKYAKPGKEDVASMLADGAMRTGKVVTDMTVLAGLGAVIKAQQDPDRYGTQWLTTALTQLMPAGSFVNTIGQATDPLVRRSERTDVGTQVAQNLQARVPWLREAVPAAQDPLGRDIESEQTGFRALNPFRPTTERADPVIQTFLDAGVDIGKPRQDLTISAYDAGGRVTESIAMPLTAAEQREWSRLRGEALTHMLEGASQDPAFASSPSAVKERYLRGKLEAANEYATRATRAQIGGEEIGRRVAPLRRAG